MKATKTLLLFLLLIGLKNLARDFFSFVEVKADTALDWKTAQYWPIIPLKIQYIVFQPFFNTKPMGQGTGLVLSLAYDIITRVHGEEIKVNTKKMKEQNLQLCYQRRYGVVPIAIGMKVETKEGQGSEFIVQLSIYR